MNNSKEARQSLKYLKKILGRFSAFDQKMQVSTILTLLEIAEADAEKREISVVDIEKAVGLLSGTASRNAYYWADGHKEGAGGHQFVKIDFGSDRRRRSLQMTPKGTAFINQLLGDIENGPTTGKPVAS